MDKISTGLADQIKDEPSMYNQLTLADFEDWMKVIALKATEKAKPRCYCGVGFLKNYYERNGREAFIAFLKGVIVTTNMEGMNYVESLKLNNG